jgi:hypothetical protein
MARGEPYDLTTPRIEIDIDLLMKREMKKGKNQKEPLG